MSSIAALIVAAGTGERAGGGTPKQFRVLAGKPLLYWSATFFASHPKVAAVEVVIGEGQDGEFERAIPSHIVKRPATRGGATRQESVRNGLSSLRPLAPEFVLIHDAARPLVSRALVDRVIEELENGSDAAVPLLPVSDTLRRQENSGNWSPVSRDRLYRAQTPQGFRFKAILDAHLSRKDREATDDMALAELAGIKVAAVAGEESNVKITTREDFALAERNLTVASEIRTGMGYDAHRFGSGDHVWLCGVRVPHSLALIGHSDADAGLHALTDAILGAIAAGDIGQHFDPKDERWRGAASSMFLAQAVKLARNAGGEIVHCDVTLICEAPKVAPYRERMRARIAEILQIELPRVSVKATTTDGMGFTGRKEGIAAQAIATVRFR
jgi:2-C-methyl-D-erythritol 4-phosphate cytidylyltransferase/2-C-methyl-D-erythritol 2,4-cyclodiphosphate synthase